MSQEDTAPSLLDLRTLPPGVMAKLRDMHTRVGRGGLTGLTLEEQAGFAAGFQAGSAAADHMHANLEKAEGSVSKALVAMGGLAALTLGAWLATPGSNTSQATHWSRGIPHRMYCVSKNDWEEFVQVKKHTSTVRFSPDHVSNCFLSVDLNDSGGLLFCLPLIYASGSTPASDEHKLTVTVHNPDYGLHNSELLEEMAKHLDCGRSSTQAGSAP